MNACQLPTVKERKPFQLYKFKGLAITAFLLLFSSISVWATHYRYGNIQWSDNGGNQVTFKIQQAWRWSYFGSPALGSTVNIAAADGAVPFEFGDGQSVDIQIVITSINAAEDWFFGEVTYVHTYASAGNYTASFSGCCRISSLRNNNDESFRLQTMVSVGNSAHSTVSTVVPIVNVPVNNPSASFTIPAVDPDGHTLNFRLANANEAAGIGNPYVQPTGLSVNSSTGLVTFSTVGKTVGNLYTSQIMINNGATEIGVDFLIKIVPSSPLSKPPYFDYAVTPAYGATLNVNAGHPLSFGVKARDDDNESSVTLTVVGMPPGAITNSVLPTTNQPVTTQFNWTPGISNVGSYILIFTATDNTGVSVSTVVKIVVTALCDPNFACYIAVNPSPIVTGGDANTIYLGYGSQSVTLTASATGGNGENTYDWGSDGTGASIIVSPTITTTYTVVITDPGHCTTTCSVTIYVVGCHLGRRKMVLIAKVPSHLKQGDKFGGRPKRYSIATLSSFNAVQSVAVKEVNIKQVKIYPNPARNYIVIQMQQDNNSKNAFIKITDVSGRTIMNIKSDNQAQQTLDVSRLESGVYIMQIVNSSGKIIGNVKFIVNK
jgi:hypothetical protein